MAFLLCGKWGLLSGCGAWASHCSGLSSQSTDSRHVGFSSCGSRRQSAGSVVVDHGLSCSLACGIFPDQGSNPCLLHWQKDSLPLSTREAWVPQFGGIFWFTPYGKGKKELHRQLFSQFCSLPFFLSSPPPAHSKTTNSFSSFPRAVS